MNQGNGSGSVYVKDSGREWQNGGHGSGGVCLWQVCVKGSSVCNV